MDKAATHASGLLMTGPYADTLTAMNNYFKYTGVIQNWAERWGNGGRDTSEMVGKRNSPQLYLDYVICSFFFFFRNT